MTWNQALFYLIRDPAFNPTFSFTWEQSKRPNLIYFLYSVGYIVRFLRTSISHTFSHITFPFFGQFSWFLHRKIAQSTSLQHITTTNNFWQVPSNVVHLHQKSCISVILCIGVIAHISTFPLERHCAGLSLSICSNQLTTLVSIHSILTYFYKYKIHTTFTK